MMVMALLYEIMDKKMIVLKKSYEVEKITKMRENEGKKEFRIKWVGFSSKESTWEPEEHIPASLVSAFLEEEKIKEVQREQRRK